MEAQPLDDISAERIHALVSAWISGLDSAFIVTTYYVYPQRSNIPNCEASSAARICGANIVDMYYTKKKVQSA